jgi:hypothetical protein
MSSASGNPRVGKFSLKCMKRHSFEHCSARAFLSRRSWNIAVSLYRVSDTEDLSAGIREKREKGKNRSG